MVQVDRTMSLQQAFLRLVDPVMVKNFCWVLKNYAHNPPVVNDCVVGFLQTVRGCDWSHGAGDFH
jgi:hypothetical protein